MVSSAAAAAKSLQILSSKGSNKNANELRKIISRNAGLRRLKDHLEDPLEKEMSTHSSILAWETPWTEEQGRLWSMESQKSQTGLNE